MFSHKCTLGCLLFAFPYFFCIFLNIPVSPLCRIDPHISNHRLYDNFSVFTLCAKFLKNTFKLFVFLFVFFLVFQQYSLSHFLWYSTAIIRFFFVLFLFSVSSGLQFMSLLASEVGSAKSNKNKKKMWNFRIIYNISLIL